MLGTETFGTAYQNYPENMGLDAYIFLGVLSYSLLLFIFTMLGNFYTAIKITLLIMTALLFFLIFFSLYNTMAFIAEKTCRFLELISFIVILFIFLFLLDYILGKSEGFIGMLKYLRGRIKSKVGERTLESISSTIKSILVVTILSFYTLLIYKFFGNEIDTFALFISGVIPVRIIMLLTLPINPINIVIGIIGIYIIVG